MLVEGWTLPKEQHTIYFTIQMQMYLSTTVKGPALRAIETVRTGGSKWYALRVMWNAFAAIKGIPEPTKQNTWHPNTHNLIYIRDTTLKNIIRFKVPRFLVRFLIVLYDFDPPWRYILDSIKDESAEMKWNIFNSGYNFFRLSKWAIKRCQLHQNRRIAIKAALLGACFAYYLFPPVAIWFTRVRKEARKMEWEKKGFSDDWAETYRWWREDNN